MELNPYQSPRELGTKPAPVKWDTKTSVFVTLMLCAMIFGVIGGGFLVFKDENAFSAMAMTAGLIPATFFAGIAYRHQRHQFFLMAAVTLAILGAICAMCFVGMLLIAFYLNMPLP